MEAGTQHDGAVLSSDYLALREISLNPGESWEQLRQGLAFIFATGGSGTYTIGEARHPLSEGQAVIMHGQTAGQLCASQSGLSFAVFMVSFEDLYPLFAGHELHLLSNLQEGFKRNGWRQAPADVAERCHDYLEDVPTRINLEHRGHLVRIAATMLSSELSNQGSGEAGYVPMEEHISQVVEKLSLDELLNLSVGELATRFGCSRRHLNRLFHRFFGVTAAALRMEMRLLKAVSLLRNPSAKVINVAEQCGFNHLGLFGICFKRRFGVSPGQWRKQTPTPALQMPAARNPECQAGRNGLSAWYSKLGDALPIMDLSARTYPETNGGRNHRNMNGNGHSKREPRVTVRTSGGRLKFRVEA